jgi:hypothetical protein
MGLELRDFFVGVVVEDTKLEVVTSGDKPILPSDESQTPNWDFRHLECFYQRARLSIVDVNRAVIEAYKEPWLCRMKVDALHAISAREELALKPINNSVTP